MKISVFGLGYVGTVTAGCLARDGHTVLGCDIDPNKVELLRGGRSPIVEEGMDALIEGAVGSGRLGVTVDAVEALAGTEISFVCVGTPSQRNGSQDLTALRRLAAQLGEGLRGMDRWHTLVIRSTVTPGTVEEIVKPIVEQHAAKRAAIDFGLCFQPEFLREGSSIRDFDNPPFTVIGVDGPRSQGVLTDLFDPLPCETLATSIRTAEMLKYCCNAFHALKITFANEIGRVCQSTGVDSHEVMRLACLDTQLNISPAYLRPGAAFGGSCLPKDLRALLYLARQHDVDIPMLGQILPSNSLHIDHAVDFVLHSGRKSVGLIGLSFKSGTDDLRESPLVAMAERFIGKGLELGIYDPEANVARLTGANRRFIEEAIPHISSLMKQSCEEVVRDAEIVVVGLSSPEIFDCLYRHIRADQTVLDLVDIPAVDQLEGTCQGVCW